MAALGIEHAKIFRLAEPPGVDEIGLMTTSTTNSAVVVPPTPTDQALAHLSVTSNKIYITPTLLELIAH
jgi:hypothetical protein